MTAIELSYAQHHSNEKSFQEESLERQVQLQAKGRLHWIHWIILALSAVMTLVAWQTSSSVLSAKELAGFERETERVVNLMKERIAHYEDALLAGVAAIQSHGGSMSREQWRTYAEFINLVDRYPGINGIGVIHYVDPQFEQDFIERVSAEYPGFSIFPEHSESLRLPITYIEPEDLNRQAIGLDVAFESNRRTAALNARSLGLTQFSGPITLVQDAQKTPGLLFYAPYYEVSSDDQMTSGVSDPEASFKGFVYAPLIVRNLVAGVLDQESRSVSLSIYDGNSAIYEEPLDQSNSKAYTASLDVPLHGRVWKFEFADTDTSAALFSPNQPDLVLITGICLELILLGLFVTMSRANSQILNLARDITESQNIQNQQLAEKNRDLEAFAHVVSHDLKTPIRNICSLTEVLSEDVLSKMAVNDISHQLDEYVGMISKQAEKGNSLITDVLDYTVAGTQAPVLKLVDTKALLQDIAESLSISSEKILFKGDFKKVFTDETRLEQVLSNLIENANKYNPDPDSAMISVIATDSEGAMKFTIIDNGPGIEERFHQQIFQPFSTLARKNQNSSGIGLSIVRRLVEIQGGRLDIDSAPGHGTSISFTWPTVSEHREVSNA